MISVTHLDGRSDPLVNIKDMTIEKEVNGAFGLSLTSFFVDNPGYDLLENESIIEYEGYEFRVKNRSRKRLSKTVRANSVFFDLHHEFVSGIQGGTRTAEEQAAFILAGTGWTFEVQGIIEPQLFLDAFGNDRALKLIRLMCETLKCEVKIMPNRHLIFAKEVGPDRDNQFRYNFNIVDLTENTDTDDLFTAIKGYGANGLEVEYIAPTASVYGVRYAESVTNEDYTVAADLIEHIKQELGERYLPQISIDVSITDLQDQGYEGIPEEGERIWLVHDDMDIELSTRVMKTKESPLKRNGWTVTLSNVKPTFSDVLVETKVEIDRNKREYRSRIHQVNERITLEVERLDGEILEAYARIQIESDRITSEVGRLDGDILTANSRITQLADSVVIEVNRIDDDLGDLETQVQINAGEISSKVSYTDYNGVEMISRINQTASSVKISAQNIDLLGIVNVANTLTVGPDAFDTSSQKMIIFSNISYIKTPQYSDDLEIRASDDLHLAALGGKVRFDQYTGGNSVVDLSTASQVIYGSNRPSSVPFADNANDSLKLQGYGATAFSFSGHSHSDYQYVKPYTGQGLKLWINPSTKEFRVYVDGALTGSMIMN